MPSLKGILKKGAEKGSGIALKGVKSHPAVQVLLAAKDLKGEDKTDTAAEILVQVIEDKIDKDNIGPIAAFDKVIEEVRCKVSEKLAENR